jgi:transketolase
MLITGDLGFGVIDEFAAKLPGQFFNSGVNEQSMMGLAAGYASQGNTVFVYSIGNFPTLRALEQIRNDVCAMNNSVIIVAVGAGYAYGPQGYTHHALEDVAVMRALPNMNVICPADPMETQLITAELCNGNAPAYLRLGKSKESLIHTTPINFVPNRFVKIFEGTIGTILFTGSIGVNAVAAAITLRESGFDVGLYSCPYISKLDVESLRDFAEIGPILTVEEHSGRGGFGSAVMEAAAENNYSVKIRMVAAKQENLSLIGDQNFLRDLNGLSKNDIIVSFQQLIESSKGNQ